MNFQAVRQVKGQKDAKDYPVKVDMIGIFAEIGGGAYTPNQKLFCDCQIRDTAQEKHKVRLYIKEAIPLSLLNTECSFSISAYDSEFKGTPYVGYSGFWNDKVISRPQSNPQAPPQSPQTPPQQANGNSGIITQVQLIQLAERFIQAIEYVVHGNIEPPKSNVNPDYVGDEPAPTDDDIPF